jgi:hemerythrin superfamily protein
MKALWALGGFAAGAMAGYALAKAGPPLISQLTGTISGAGGRDAFEGLIEDHRKVLALLDEMIEAEAPRRMALFLQLKRDLSKHALSEEDVVYPLLRERAHDYEDTQRNYAEHAEMKIALASIEELLMNADLTSDTWREHMRRLRHLIAAHARHEEDNEFPRLRESLGDEKRAAVSGMIAREKALLV